LADNSDALKPSPEQYLEQAKIIRWQAETMSADVRRQLLEIAEKYEELAYSIEGARRGGD
jgi:predicted kinase